MSSPKRRGELLRLVVFNSSITLRKKSAASAISRKAGHVSTANRSPPTAVALALVDPALRAWTDGCGLVSLHRTEKLPFQLQPKALVKATFGARRVRPPQCPRQSSFQSQEPVR